MKVMGSFGASFPMRAIAGAGIMLVISACGGSGDNLASPTQTPAGSESDETGLVVFDSERTADLTTVAVNANSSSSLVSAQGQWVTWEGQDSGIRIDANSGALTLPASAADEYVYGVRRYFQSLVPGALYTLQVNASDDDADVRIFLLDADDNNIAIADADTNSLSQWGVATNSKSLQFYAPAGVSNFYLQVQSGRGAEAGAVAFELTQSSGRTNTNGDNLLDLTGPWHTWGAEVSSVYYDDDGQIVIPTPDAGTEQRSAIKTFIQPLDAGALYSLNVDSAQGAGAVIFLHDTNGKAIYFSDVSSGLSAEAHPATTAYPLRFYAPSGVQQFTIQVQGAWQEYQQSSLSLVLTKLTEAVPAPATNIALTPALEPTPVAAPTSAATPASAAATNSYGRPRVVVLTDINQSGGDPDDAQSLVHLFWYADELDIRALVPDKWGGGGYSATMQGIGAYESDYYSQNLAEKGYPTPQSLRERVASNEASAVQAIAREADASGEPLYVLVWGGMRTLKATLNQRPDLSSKLRVLSIATDRRFDPGSCTVSNWNSLARNEIFNDGRFKDLWWVESNWTYNGMFDGPRPAEMLNTMSGYGSMGWQIKSVVGNFSWAQYFRAGDTPTVLYLLDPSNNRDNPTSGSWAGQFARPFADRPNYYTDSAGDNAWDYYNPCNTWYNATNVYNHAKATLQWRREGMYSALIQKLNLIYSR